MQSNIITSLDISKNNCCCKASCHLVRRGSTVYLLFPVGDTFESIHQATFMIRQEFAFWSFKAFKYNESGECTGYCDYPEDGVHFDDGQESDPVRSIRFILDPKFTAKLTANDEMSLALYEVAVEYSNDTSTVESEALPVIIYPQSGLLVEDTLYSKIVEEE